MSNPSELRLRLIDLKNSYQDFDPKLVRELVSSVFGEYQSPAPEDQNSLLHEVAKLGDIISSARSEIATLQVDDITGKHIPFATDELDAIVAHTAVATEVILETCETLDHLGRTGAGAGVIADYLQAATTRIYEACSFQDITGQRISKVVSALKQIDQKISHLIRTFGPDYQMNEMAVDPDHVRPMLLNGPQLPYLAMDQLGVDRLLADFD